METLAGSPNQWQDKRSELVQQGRYAELLY
jgi:hypothetical protein